MIFNIFIIGLLYQQVAWFISFGGLDSVILNFLKAFILLFFLFCDCFLFKTFLVAVTLFTWTTNRTID